MVAFCPTPLLGLFVTIITPGTPNTHTRNHGVIENLRRLIILKAMAHIGLQSNARKATEITEKLEGCSCILMLRRECGAAILVEVSPERLPAAGSESQRADREHRKRPILLLTRARFA
jgi:hypothetical protein